jgi:hypothetical protein
MYDRLLLFFQTFQAIRSCYFLFPNFLVHHPISYETINELLVPSQPFECRDLDSLYPLLLSSFLIPCFLLFLLKCPLFLFVPFGFVENNRC